MGGGGGGGRGGNLKQHRSWIVNYCNIMMIESAWYLLLAWSITLFFIYIHILHKFIPRTNANIYVGILSKYFSQG